MSSPNKKNVQKIITRNQSHQSILASEKANGIPINPTHALDRRAVLKSAVAFLGAAAVHAVTPHLSAQTPQVPDDPTRVPGTPSSPYGSRSTFEQAVRLVKPNRSRTPLHALHGVVTPSALHFERHHNGVPIIDPVQHRLLVHGLVERSMMFTVSDLMRFPSVSRLAFIECSGNSGSEWKNPGKATVQEIHGLTSTSEWTGVSLATLLREVGVTSEATWMLAEGSDAAAMTRSIPLAEVLDDALLCYAQNGEALRPEQGYPLRLLLPRLGRQCEH